MSIARSSADNCNVELGERSGFKRFNHGITDFLRNFRRIDGGWYISMVRQLHVCLCTTTEYFNATTRRDIAKAFETCVRVHTNLRCPVRKDGLKDYQWLINDLLTIMVAICTPSTLGMQVDQISLAPSLGADTQGFGLQRHGEKLGTKARRNAQKELPVH